MFEDRRGNGALTVACVAAIGMIISGAASLAIGHPHAAPSGALSDAAAAANAPVYADRFVTGNEQQFRVARPAQLRNLPTVDGSAIVEALTAGTVLTGKQVYAAHGDNQWLRVERQGTVGYVWAGNLSPVDAAPAQPATVAGSASAGNSSGAGAPAAFPQPSEVPREQKRSQARRAEPVGESAPRVTCVLPSAQEVSMTREKCTQSAGVVLE